MTTTPRNLPTITLTGREVCRLMRRHRVTIRELSQRMSIPMTTIRRRRAIGLDSFSLVLDWCEAIEGELSPRLRAAWASYRRMRDEVTI